MKKLAYTLLFTCVFTLSFALVGCGGDSAPASTAPAKYKVGSSDFILSNGESGNVNPYKNLSCKWDDNRDYLYPIPTDERNLTGGALTQNPGWNDGLTF